MKASLVYSAFMVVLGGTTAAKPCPPLGPILPPVADPLSLNIDIQQAAKHLTTAFNKLMASGNTTSVAVQMTSLSDASPLFEFFHTAPTVNRTGAQLVTPQTQFRLGSVTKLFTVLAMLLHEKEFDWMTPISHHIPELLSHKASAEYDGFPVRWEHVSLDSLASQLGGIPRDIQDLALLYDLPWAQYGFPILNGSDLPPCGVASNLPPCDQTAYINAIKIRDAAFAPYRSPLYSNAAYALLGLSLERILQKGYATIIRESILDPLQMKHSSINTPDAKEVLIPADDSQWDLDNDFLRPSGQMYSSIADLSTFALSILNSTLLNPVQTSHWLKPHTHTSSLTASVGGPWEIFRTNELTPDGRVIDIYTKNGGIGAYGSYLVLVPDYNVAITCLSAGSNNAFPEIPEAVLKAMIPTIDKVGREQATEKYVGIYKDPQGRSNMNITITDTGLRVNEWFNDGKDILTEYAAIFQPFQLDLYPTGVNRAVKYAGQSKAGHEVSYIEQWRGVYSYSEYPYDGFLDQCSTWLGIDGNIYGQKALDEFTFEGNAKGEVISIRNEALRTTLYKQ
ncbi:hypothetical protein PoHVEF18_004261 [Penicillium ochrochloron]